MIPHVLPRAPSKRTRSLSWWNQPRDTSRTYENASAGAKLGAATPSRWHGCTGRLIVDRGSCGLEWSVSRVRGRKPEGSLRVPRQARLMQPCEFGHRCTRAAGPITSGRKIRAGGRMKVGEPWCCEPVLTDGPGALGGITVCCLPSWESTRGSCCQRWAPPERRKLGAGLGDLFFSAPLPFRISLPAIGIWTALVILGAVLATEAAATRASRLTVREALAYL